MNGRPLRVVVLFAFLAAVTGCAAGADSPIQEVKPRHPSGEVGPVAVRSLMILSAPMGDDGAAVVTLVNTGDEPATLMSLVITPGDEAALPLEVPAGITVLPGEAVYVGAENEPALPIPGLDQAVTSRFVPVTLVFDKAGRLTLNVLVQEATGPYAPFLPSPVGSSALQSSAETAAPPSPSSSG